MMKRWSFMCFALLVACPSDNQEVLDVSIQSSDAATDMVTGVQEIGTPFVSFDTPAQDVEIRGEGAYLFWREDATFFWAAKEDATPIQYFVWPDRTFPGPAGEFSRDFAIGSDRTFVVGSVSDSQTAVVGAEHELGNPFPLFGQPVIILDVGGGTDFRGISVWGDIVIAGINDRAGISDPHIVIASENNVTEFIDTPRFRSTRFSPTELGPVFVTDQGVQRFAVTNRTLETLIPSGTEAVVTADAVFVQDDETLLTLERSCQRDCEATVVENGFSPGGWHAFGNDVVTFDGARIGIVGQGEIGSATGEVLSIFTDGSSIYWATSEGIYFHPLR